MRRAASASPGFPVGTVMLRVDGKTTSRPGTWPYLMFHFTTISGVDNSLGMPIRLLPIDVAGGKVVGGPDEVVIQMKGVPGATLTVAPNSVTFPDGSKTGIVSFTQVHGDKVPMIAPMGSGFTVAFTVQPPGTRFDPPAVVTLPNIGLPPGSEVDLFSFDHDIGEFLTVGTATVTPDGLLLRSNPGTGITKAGWAGGVPPPPPLSDTCHPGACTNCVGGRPVPKCDECSVCGGGSKAECAPRTLDTVKVVGPGNEPDLVVIGKGQSADLSVTVTGTCMNRKVTWNFGDGGAAGEGESVSRVYDRGGDFTATATVECTNCGSIPSKTDTIRVVVIDAKVDSLSPATELKLGEDLTVRYTIDVPGGITLDRVELRILNASDEILFSRNDLAASSGSNTTTWPKGKTSSGAFANPKQGEYKVVIVAIKGSGEAKSPDDKTIKTKLVLEADIHDKPSSNVPITAGLRDLSRVLKVVMKSGSNETVFSGGSLTINPVGSGETEKRIEVDVPGLNNLEDGDYDVLFRDLRDDIGNFSDEDDDLQNGVQPIKFQLKLRSSP